MKIFCVSGGNYKSFYLNAFLKIRGYDLLVINFGIMYEMLTKEDEQAVKNELMLLQEKARVPVVAGVKFGNKRVEKIFVCDSGKCELRSIKQGVRLSIKNRIFVIGGKFTEFGNFHKIVLSENRIKVNPLQCSYKKIYVFCDNFGITKIEKRKSSRKFYKYAKIILK